MHSYFWIRCQVSRAPVGSKITVGPCLCARFRLISGRIVSLVLKVKVLFFLKQWTPFFFSSCSQWYRVCRKVVHSVRLGVVIWLKFIRSMKREAECVRSRVVPFLLDFVSCEAF